MTVKPYKQKRPKEKPVRAYKCMAFRYYYPYCSRAIHLLQHPYACSKSIKSDRKQPSYNALTETFQRY